MCTFKWLFGIPAVAVLLGCGSNLTLPDDGSPARLLPVSGGGQEGIVGSRLDDPLIVQLTDAIGQPIQDVPVEFRFQSSTDAEVSPSSVPTDEEGRASAEVRLGSTAGDLTVEALVAQSSSSALKTSFDLTALEREHGGKAKKEKKQGNDEGDEDD